MHGVGIKSMGVLMDRVLGVLSPRSGIAYQDCLCHGTHPTTLPLDGGKLSIPGWYDDQGSTKHTIFYQPIGQLLIRAYAVWRTSEILLCRHT